MEKIFEDVRVGSVASYAERFFDIVGSDVRGFLGPQVTNAGAASASRPN